MQEFRDHDPLARPEPESLVIFTTASHECDLLDAFIVPFIKSNFHFLSCCIAYSATIGLIAVCQYPNAKTFPTTWVVGIKGSTIKGRYAYL